MAMSGSDWINMEGSGAIEAFAGGIDNDALLPEIASRKGDGNE
jgi:hypothetical protein